MKLETNGVMTLKNINLLNNDFFAKISTLEQEVNEIQQTFRTAIKDICENSANGDFAFSAESGTVWMYDQNCYNSGDIVPEQVTSASDATPLANNGTGVAGTSNEYSRVDHMHPLQVSTLLPAKNTATGEEGVADTYARSGHQHPIQTVGTISVSDSTDASYGTVDSYARNNHSHPLNIDPTTANVPLVNATDADNGASYYYCRNDHVHPQQLTYEGNLTATKLIKSGALATEVLCANGDTTTLDNMLPRTYSGIGWVKLCVIPVGASVGNPFIEFKIYSSYNAVQIIRLQPNYTENGITNVYEIFNAPTYIGTQYVFENGARQLFHIHSGSSTSAIYSAYIRLETVGGIRIVVTDQSIYFTNRVTEILSQDIFTTVSTGTQIPINYNFGYGGIIGTVAGQWEVSKNNDDALTIVPSSLRQTDHSVDVGTDQTITGIKQFINVLQVNTTNNKDYIEGIRISRSTNNQSSNIQLGCDQNSDYGFIDNQWLVGTPGDHFLNPLGFVIVKAGQQMTANRGLMINAEEYTLTFNCTQA
ncbi:MAG: hypothetical protein EZS28_006559 [Streblomastix strix]|uniref:Uncharacterized protein n=1 Tax=Streblomastix strix TaxID=222440 RepID=A0A5J4WS10_9EUKA|nr:MAG: hypothetical protein EZS28_006559 [Streblomastix strix]